MGTVNEKLAHFVHSLRYEDLPDSVIEKAKINLLHGLAVALAGVKLEFARIAVQALEESGEVGGGNATLLLDGRRSTPMGAAFANAVLFHSRTQEDTHGTTHCGPTVIPPALALAEAKRASGRDFLTSLVVGYEVAAAVGKHHTKYSTPRGFRASSIYGIFGAAAASGKLLGLTEEQLVNALGYAAAFAFGTTETFNAGTMEWRYEVGLAARNGLLAAMLAKKGAVAATTAMEGKAGFYHAFAGTTAELDMVTAGLGKEWEILAVDLKPYPVCAFNQTPVSTMLNLVQETGLRAEDVEAITVWMSPYEANYPGMASKGPFNSIGATLMSTPFCVALACVEGRVTVGGLQQYDHPQINELVSKVTIVPDEGRPMLCTKIRVATKDGRTYEKETIVAPDQYRYTWEQEVRLVKGMQEDMNVPPERLDDLIGAVRRVETIGDVSELVAIAVP